MAQPINLAALLPNYNLLGQQLSQDGEGIGNAINARNQAAMNRQLMDWQKEDRTWQGKTRMWAEEDRARQIQQEQEKDRQAQIEAQRRDQFRIEASKARRGEIPWGDVLDQYPEYVGEIKSRYEVESGMSADSAALERGQLFAAVKSGKLETARTILEQKRDLAIKSGNKALEADANEDLALLDSDPKKLALSAETTFATFAPDKYKQYIEANKTESDRKISEKKSKEETKAFMMKTAAELKAMQRANNGEVPEDKRIETEFKLRKELGDELKTHESVKTNYEKLKVVGESPIGDIALVFGFMKMLDPASTVREGEVATTRNAAGIPERIMNLYNKAAKGESLSDEQRAQIRKEAESQFKVSEKKAEELKTNFGKIAKNYGLDMRNIFVSGDPTQAPAQKPNTPPPGAKVLKFNPATGKVE